MSIKDRILKRRERFAYERAHWVDADPEESWFYLMTNIQRNNLYSLVLIGPAIFCILFYYFTGITPNIALSYLIIDMIVIFAKRHLQSEESGRIRRMPGSVTAQRFFCRWRGN